MNRRIRLAPLLSLGLLLAAAGAAAAQPSKPAGPAAAAASTAEEEPLPRWDAAGFIGWRGARFDTPFYSGHQWDARFVGGGTAGYYWTPNLKVEADVSLTPPSRFEEYQQRQVDGVPYPFYVRVDHRAVTASFGGMFIYQFFENASFHPFLGAGVGMITIRDRISTQRQTQTYQGAPNVPARVILLTEQESRSETDHHGRGLIVAGFKAYPGERVFFRSDVQWAVADGNAREISWRIGVGVDF